jgi:eukaryotic-like serine/threonine-protein kinase
MKPEDWGQIEWLYHAALERSPDERAAFLDAACKDDQDLRREVESLLAYDERAQHFIAAPPDTMAAEMVAAERAPALVGGDVSHYRILSLLGRGGMGAVYLALDTNLGRKIALKLLPEQFTKDTEQVRRFEREARAASALNHPNIITIHEIGAIDHCHFIISEFVEGQTLRRWIANNPMELNSVLDIAIQVASALAAAHAAGITHRDVKPENVMLRPDGLVKVLDFGLAKLTETQSTTDETQASMIGTLSTETGAVIGTVRYMSPEQARGQKVDERTDIFSLGVMLYEMVAGRRPFEGQTASDCIAALLTAEPPPLGQSRPGTPAELERIIKKCLLKEREGRYRSAHELFTDLSGLKRNYDQGNLSAEKAVSRQERSISRFARIALIAAALALSGIGLYLFSLRDKAIDSVAVLPFANESADPQMEYLSDGITESLIRSLSQLPDLKVSARASVFRFKGREVDPRTVGQELGVRAVLMGRLVRRDGGISISVELVDALNNNQIWSDQYNWKPADLSAIQADIVKDIAERLRLKLTGEEERLLAKRRPGNAEAYRLYLIGRYYWNKRTEEGLKKAIDYFRQAIDLEPGYALAYTGLADSYSSLVFSFDVSVLPPRDGMPKAKDAALKARDLDDSLAEAHTSLAMIKLHYDWDWPEAEREFNRAIRLDPNHVNAHHWYSHYLLPMGRIEESLAESSRALQLDPLGMIINVHLGWHYLYTNDYDQAIKQLSKTIEMDNNYGLAHRFLGLAYERKGMYAEAITELQKAVSLVGGTVETKAELAHAYAVSGKSGEAHRILDQLNQQSKQHYVSPYLIALIYAGLGNKEQAFERLEKAYDDRSDLLVYLKVEPKLANLHSDPRFQDLLRRLRLAP